MSTCSRLHARAAALATTAALHLLAPPAGAQQRAAEPDLSPEPSVSYRIEVRLLARDLGVPSSIALLPDGRFLVADRAGPALWLFDGEGPPARVEGLPEIAAGFEDSGLHDILPDPAFADNHVLFLTYSVPMGGTTYTLGVARARLEGERLVDLERIFTAEPAVEGGHHFGGRMVRLGEHLFVTSGDRDHREYAQDRNTHLGKVLRIHTDGSVPSDNPFVGQQRVRPEIWSYGHRNPQGLAVDPATGDLIAHEHGPLGGDEINVVRPGLNYGWPITSFGFEYDGGPIGMGIVDREDIERPVHVYVPSIAPSGLVVYSGDAFPAWRGSLLLGALNARHVNRVVLRTGDVRLSERARVQEHILGGRGFRVRALVETPEGHLLVGVDGGLLLRLSPISDDRAG